MKDRKLERQIKDLDKFIGGWKRLGGIAFSKDAMEKISDEELLRMKEELASIHGSLMISLETEESRCIEFLERLSRDLQGAGIRRLEDSWQGCLLFMDEINGRLKQRKKELAGISRSQVAMRTFFSNPFVRLAALFLCLLLLYCIITTFVVREESAEEDTGVTIGWNFTSKGFA